MNPETYCENKTRGSGSSFFYAFLFLPEEQRRAMMALYAFCREVDDIADEVSDEGVALQKLGFWREEIARVFADQPTHPVGRELQRARQRFAFSEELFVEIIDGMLMDVTHQPMLKAADLSLYCYRVAGVVGLLSIEVFGHTNRHASDFAVHLGKALQLTNILRDVREDALRGRIYFPQEDRIRYGVADEDFRIGRMQALLPLLEHYADEAEREYGRAVAALPPEDRIPLRPSLLMAAIYHAHLGRLKAAGYDVWQRPVRLSPLRKMWIAWRAWRHEKKAAKRTPPAPVRLDF
ncbi:MAG TPA: presqualene diphosphate synthase HpnD [Mariprofundaceae bacterium]|nr:presqualene diphosphate synthase HpnD [Mariprofundaceae bacterium]